MQVSAEDCFISQRQMCTQAREGQEPGTPLALTPSLSEGLHGGEDDQELGFRKTTQQEDFQQILTCIENVCT